MRHSERNVNIVCEGIEGQDSGYVSIFRPIDFLHEQDLIKPNKFSKKAIGLSSPLACPLFYNAQYCEESGTVPTWIGVEDEE